MKKSYFWKVLLAGAVIGLINGFFGGGGGMIVVPFLQKIFGMDEKSSHASAIFVILPISIASAVIYITTNTLQFGSSWFTILGVLAGGTFGAFALSKLKNNVIGIVFAFLMLASGIYLALR